MSLSASETGSYRRTESGTRGARDDSWAVAALLGAAGLLGGLVSALTESYLGAAVLGALVCLSFPVMVGRVSTVLLLALGPLYNPPIAGSAANGRVYLSSALVIVIFVSGVASLRPPRHWPRGIIALLGLIILYCGVMYRPDAVGVLPWLFRPLQPLLVATGVALLFRERLLLAAKLYRLMVMTGVAGAALGVANAVFPAFDPFVLTRPADLPFVSQILFFTRATGGFVYPNVFGVFCVMLALAGVSATVSHRLRPRLARAALLAGTAGAVTSASRAALGGLVLGVLYVIFRGQTGQRAKRLVGLIAAGVVALLLVYASPTGHQVLSSRLADATGQSLQFRLYNTRYGWTRLKQSPILGSGIEQSRLDNGILLYLYTGGIIGFSLLVTALRKTMTLTAGTGHARVPIESGAMLVALAGSSMLQDTLGQTLSSWFWGASFGLLSVLGSVSPAEPKLDVAKHLGPHTKAPRRAHAVGRRA